MSGRTESKQVARHPFVTDPSQRSAPQALAHVDSDTHDNEHLFRVVDRRRMSQVAISKTSIDAWGSGIVAHGSTSTLQSTDSQTGYLQELQQSRPGMSGYLSLHAVVLVCATSFQAQALQEFQRLDMSQIPSTSFCPLGNHNKDWLSNHLVHATQQVAIQ